MPGADRGAAQRQLGDPRAASLQPLDAAAEPAPRTRRTPARASPASRPSGASGRTSRRRRTRRPCASSALARCSSAGIRSRIDARRRPRRGSRRGRCRSTTAAALTSSFGCTSPAEPLASARRREHLVHVHVAATCRSRSGTRRSGTARRGRRGPPRRPRPRSPSASSGSSTPSSRVDRCAAAALMRASASICAARVGCPEIGKFSTARWVWAPHLASAGTRTSPIESCSIRSSLTG